MPHSSTTEFISLAKILRVSFLCWTAHSPKSIGVWTPMVQKVYWCLDIRTPAASRAAGADERSYSYFKCTMVTKSMLSKLFLAMIINWKVRDNTCRLLLAIQLEIRRNLRHYQPPATFFHVHLLPLKNTPFWRLNKCTERKQI